MTLHVTWQEVADRLAGPRNYWLGTTDPQGDPHAAPVWGAVVEGQLYLYSERRTKKARNVSSHSEVVVHLESGDDVVIVHGQLEDLGIPGARADVVAALSAKYPDDDEADLPAGNPAFDVLWVLIPSRALMWDLEDYERSQKRWSHEFRLPI